MLPVCESVHHSLIVWSLEPASQLSHINPPVQQTCCAKQYTHTARLDQCCPDLCCHAVLAAYLHSVCGEHEQNWHLGVMLGCLTAE